MSDSSYSSIAPNPLQRGHAPRGLLNEKSCGVGAGARVPSLAHSKRSVNRSRVDDLAVERRAHRLGEEDDHIAVALAERGADASARRLRCFVADREPVDDDQQLLRDA